MPAAKRITGEEIISAAFCVLRESGFAAVNARSVAKKLGCSTQPIYLCFKNMKELKAALTARAAQQHIERVRRSIRENNGSRSRYSDYGIGFVRFAEQEKQLFRWLYLEEGQLGKQQYDILLPEIIDIIVKEFGYTRQVAQAFHRDMTYYSYGLAILANTGHLALTETELREAFRREFRALAAYYGPPKKLPEFAERENAVHQLFR